MWYIQIVKYFLVSVLATSADFLTFMGAYRIFENLVIANFLAFSLGLVVSYTLSLLFVFKTRRLKKQYEFPIFALIGVVGFSISTLAIYVALDLMGFSPSESKIISIGATFFWNFWMKKILLFSKKKNT